MSLSIQAGGMIWDIIWLSWAVLELWDFSESGGKTKLKTVISA